MLSRWHFELFSFLVLGKNRCFSVLCSTFFIKSTKCQELHSWTEANPKRRPETGSQQTVCAEWTKEQFQQCRIRNLDARVCSVRSDLQVNNEFACSASPCVPSRSPQENHQYSHTGSTYLCKSTTRLLIISYL